MNGPRALLVLLAASLASEPALRDRPVIWYEDDRRDIPRPETRDPSLIWDTMREGFFRPLGRLTDPVRLARTVGGLFGADHVPAASDLNTLDEVPNSTWFTNRI